MHVSSRQVIASIIGTVLMVVLTVVLATWFPAEQGTPADDKAAVLRLSEN
ncbi:archaellin/type IV pilin N-terminal domain-containing protein [Actinopolyspora halophila]|nr:archaellin/type IV pilin N-terminal domain-containing protein [Actinopolyspora halophila]